MHIRNIPHCWDFMSVLIEIITARSLIPKSRTFGI
ncbi:hypothetical protein F383_12064 [Gossypium arboreum]|uniref:Uncharacterized protein n=1 Tax=Gossypium arboreum TaxID=29729 RepID=A0A0B0NIF3_GOSAR|nr:hypothetical protein F383_12064 [Gossypium arboreum]